MKYKNTFFSQNKKKLLTLLLVINFVTGLTAQELKPEDGQDYKHKVGMIYNYDIFLGSDFRPWQLATVQYEHYKPNTTYVGRVNYANRFSLHAFQAELEAYPKIGKKGYMYLGAGYSADELFPQWRAGAEYFRSLPKAWEASLGFRYLQFLNPQWVPTATLGKYLGNYYISFRAFVALDRQAYTSTLLLIRKYTKDKYSFFNFMMGTGYSPDDFSRINRNLEIAPALFSLNVALEYQHLMQKDWMIRGGLRFNREEYLPDFFRNRYGIIINLSKLF